MWNRIGDTKEFYKWRPIYNRIQYRPLTRTKLVRCLHVEKKPTMKRGTTTIIIHALNFVIETTGFGDQKFKEIGGIFYNLQIYFPNGIDLYSMRFYQ